MSGIQFDPDAIRALAQILKDTDLTEIELVEKDSRIRVARAAPVAAPAWPSAVPVAAPPVPTMVHVAAPQIPTTAQPGLITSPMVGVAYLSPDPGSANFVSVGARVAQGQTLLLIEAMKTFNQIRSPRDGVVTRVLIESGTPVEYGAPLLVVE